MNIFKPFFVAGITALAITSGFIIPDNAFASPPKGKWIINQSSSMPGFTRIVITQKDNLYSGFVTSQWYGDMPLRDVQIDGDTINFHLFNGNMRVPLYPISVKSDGDNIKLKGRIWDSEFDLIAQPANDTQIKQRDFTKEELPPKRELKPVNLAATPPMGWSSWNKFADNIDDKTIRGIADAMVSSGLRDVGYKYINIDDGWVGTRDNDGNIRPNEKFPDMKALADYVHSKGLKLGIYSSQGPKTCAGYEGSYGHIEQDAKTYADWGVDFLKYDLCSGEAFYNTADTVYRSYQQMGEALRRTNRDIIYSLCEYGRFNVGSWGAKVGGHMWRTTGDIEDNYASMSRIGFDLHHKSDFKDTHGWNDPDMLEVGNGGMSYDEYKTHFTLWAMLSAPLILGNDLRQMDEKSLEIAKNNEIIAIDQDKNGIQGKAISKADNVEIWSKPLIDGSIAIAFFNRNNETKEIKGSWKNLNIKPQKLRDLWLHKNIKPSENYSLILPPHGVIIYKVK